LPQAGPGGIFTAPESHVSGSRPRHLVIADDLGADDLGEVDEAKERARCVRGCAVALSKPLGAAISLVYVEDLRASHAAKAPFQEFARLHEEIKSRIASAARSMPVPVDCLVRFGSPAEEILRLASSRPFPELLVLGTHGRRGLNRLLVGSVAEEVIRHCPRPVLVVGPRVCRAPRLEQAEDPRVRILVATELGRNSRGAEQYALSLARRLGAKVLLYHCLWDRFRVIQEGILNSGAVVFDLEVTMAEIRANAILSLERKSLYFRERGVRCEFVVEERAIRASAAVPEMAGSGFSFVITGTHGRGALMNAFFGSTARETILNAEAPVITVRSR